MKINVRLSSRGETRSIIYRISFRAYEKIGDVKKYRQLDYSTGLSVDVKSWDTKKRITRNDSYKNGQVARGIARVLEIGSKLSSENQLTFDKLRSTLDSDQELSKIFNRDREIKKERDYIAPFQFIEEFIKKAIVTDGTKKVYRNYLSHLIAFDKYRG